MILICEDHIDSVKLGVALSLNLQCNAYQV